MDITRAQQKALDDDLVAPANHALTLTSFYKAFEITADVPKIYMQEFWVTASRHHSSLRFKMNGKIHIVNVDNFRDMLQICPKLPDLVYQVENKNSKKNNDMYYPRFTKVIVDYFMAKDQSIPRRKKMFWHTARDDPMFTTIRVISKHQDTQIYGAILPQHLTNQAMLESEAYKTYHAYATGEKIPKPKYVKNKVDPESSPKKKSAQASKGKQIKTSKNVKKKQPETTSKEKGLNVLSKVALVEAGHIKLATKRSLIQTHSSHASGSSADEGTGVIPGVPDTESENDDDNFVHPKLSTFDEKERQDEEYKEDKEEEWSDDEAYDDETQGANVEGEELDEEETNEEDKTNVQSTQVTEDTHVIITAATPEVPQQSSSASSGFISNMLNPNPDTGIDSILNLNTKLTSLVDVPVTTNVEMPPSFVTTLPPPPIPFIQPQQQTPVSTPTIVPSTSLQNLPTFGSLFNFEDRVKALEDDFSEFKQTSQFATAVSSIPGIVDTYLANKINEAIKTAIQLQSDKLRTEAQADNEDFFINKIDENMKKIIKEQVNVQVKEQVFKILSKIEKFINDQLEAEVLTHSSNEAKTSYAWIPVENYANQLFVEEHISFVYIAKICIENQDNKHDGFSALPISTSTFHNKRNSVSLGRFASDSLAWYMLKRSYAHPSSTADKKNFLRSSYKKVAAQMADAATAATLLDQQKDNETPICHTSDVEAAVMQTTRTRVQL
ncbi:hypothetical protein Tco_0169074 [Tanacetum coccineum]